MTDLHILQIKIEPQPVGNLMKATLTSVAGQADAIEASEFRPTRGAVQTGRRLAEVGLLAAVGARVPVRTLTAMRAARLLNAVRVLRRTDSIGTNPVARIGRLQNKCPRISIGINFKGIRQHRAVFLLKSSPPQ